MKRIITYVKNNKGSYLVLGLMFIWFVLALAFREPWYVWLWPLCIIGVFLYIAYKTQKKIEFRKTTRKI